MKIKVWGDYALFTKPWSKPEPTSFPVPPPTALQGLLRAIFFKPEFEYQITRVLILKPIQWQSIRVNAVNKLGAVEITEARTQRKQKCLKDVAYVIEFEVIAEDVKKYTSMFYRRLERGQYFKMPCLGITDFKCYFGMTNNSDKPCAEVNYESLLMPAITHFVPDKKGGYLWVIDGKETKCRKVYEPREFSVEKGVMNIV